MAQFSSGEVDRLGKRLREAEGRSRSAEDVAMYVAWSTGYARAMQEVRTAIFEQAVEASVEGTISSRVKQIDSVAAKLRRMPTMRLSVLEDIAGCRIVVATTRDADRLAGACSALKISRKRNYHESPHNGYRALHLTVRASDERPVELQIRTEIEDLWANLAERCAALVDPDLKYGGGPQPLREFLEMMSDLGCQLDIASADVQTMRDLAESDARGRASNSGGLARSQPAQDLLEVEEVLRRALDGFRRICDAFPNRLEDEQR